MRNTGGNDRFRGQFNEHRQKTKSFVEVTSIVRCLCTLLFKLHEKIMMGSLSISNVIYQQDIKRLGNIYEIDISYQIT